MNTLKAIEQLGYKPHEAKVYLATLSLSECTVSDISVKVNMPRSSTQISLDKLHKDGLVNFYIRKNHKYWVAEPPDKLLSIIKEKEKIITFAMKDLMALRHSISIKPTVKVFTGTDEIRLVHNNIIEAKHHISAIIPWETWVNLLGQDYINDFVSLRIQHFLNIRMLVPKTSNSLKLKTEDAKNLRHIKFLPENISIEDALFLFGDSVAIISLNERQPTSVVIEDPATARMMNVFFEDLWSRGGE